MSRTKDRFPTRRQWHNTMIVAWVVPGALLVGVLIFAATGLGDPLIVIGIGLLVGMIIALVRDLGKRCNYEVSSGILHLVSGRHKRDIALEDIADVSLIDRSGARAYINDRSIDEAHGDRSDKRRMFRDFNRYCTVDIGITSFTLGIGRYFTDRLPNARRDVLLVRLKDGSALLLSPEFNQEMVSSLTRGSRKRS